MTDRIQSRTRRTFMKGGLSLGTFAVTGTAPLIARAASLGYDRPGTLPDHGLILAPTPACSDGHEDQTPATTAGPYYSAGTPLRANLLEGSPSGRVIRLTGRVLGTDCRPIPHAALDFWHADANGAYDNRGFRFRGHQFADNNGVFELVTIKPRFYGETSFFRAPHFHVKVQGEKTGVLTTQLFFPDETEANRKDRLIKDGLTIAYQEEKADRLEGRFDFVLKV